MTPKPARPDCSFVPGFLLLAAIAFLSVNFTRSRNDFLTAEGTETRGETPREPGVEDARATSG